MLDIHDGPVQYLFTALSLLTGLQTEAADGGGSPELQAPTAVRTALISLIAPPSACLRI